MACSSNRRCAVTNSSPTERDFMHFVASAEDVNASGVNESNSDVEVVGEVKCNMDDHRCDLCAKGEFLVDKLSHYGETVDSEYKYMCGICDLSFKSRSSYRNHMISPCSSNSYQNKPECKTTLIKIKTPNSSPVVCTICNKELKNNRGLFRHHVEQHSGVTHVCSVCKEVFSSFKKFTYHCYQHESSSKKICRCLECGEKFYNKCDFRKHLKLHDV